jgi:hypothetical protein
MKKRTPISADQRLAKRETRLQYLKRVDPKNPEIKKLERQTGGGASIPGGEGKPAFDEAAVNQFLENALNGLGSLDLSGAPKLLSDGDTAAQRQATQDALYAEDTKFLDRNRARSLEEAKQEMANRGIPYDPAAAQDPNTQNLYGRTIGAIEEGYKGDQASALNRARTGADQRMATEVGSNIAARNSFADHAAQAWHSKVDALNTGNSLLQTMMQKYGIDQATAQSILDRKSNERLVKMGIRAKGSGGGGNNSGGDDSAGFEII